MRSRVFSLGLNTVESTMTFVIIEDPRGYQERGAVMMAWVQDDPCWAF